ncbi:hypothetical protein [Kineococcus indalonis]|uniref:hypothetical protein n=1 Tax=Kineococcus indalonis TaxID=2696566 RepID=UPI001411F37F|nr:hypothetical protein [Kineococcus indalonis]NAZ85596.1 hypothetical protein [Kineococcus indalonis]
MKLRQRAAVALVTAASTVAVAGCTVFSPAVTLRPYDPSDGKNSRVAGVEVRNALVVSPGVDEPGVVSVTLVNSSDTDESVTVSADVDAGQAPSQTFTVPAGQVLQVGASAAATPEGASTVEGPEQDAGWMQIPQVPVYPGQTVQVTFRAGSETSQVEAPVVLPCFEYASLTPTAAPTAAAGAAPSPTASVACGPATDDNLQQSDDEGENETGGEPEATPTEVAEGDTSTGIGGDTQADAEGTGEAGSGGQ